MNHVNQLKRPQSRLARMITATSLVIMFFAQTGSVFAHGVLEVKNTDGMVVGWLLNKIPDSLYATYLTPDGYLLTLSGIGSTSNSALVAPTRLVYESDDCTGQAYVENNASNSQLQGEIFQIGINKDSLHARMDRGVKAFAKVVASQKIEDAVCKQIVAQNANTIVVEEVQPTDYGITESISGTWRVNIETFDVQLPNLISCNGFESCP